MANEKDNHEEAQKRGKTKWYLKERGKEEKVGRAMVNENKPCSLESCFKRLQLWIILKPIFLTPEFKGILIKGKTSKSKQGGRERRKGAKIKMRTKKGKEGQENICI